MKRFVFGVLGGLFVAAVLGLALVPLLMQTDLAERFGGTDENAIEVRVSEAELGSLTRSINAPGEIEAEQNVEISAQVSARVVEMPFDEGDAIRSGEVVVRLDDRDLSAALDAATAQMLADEARLLGAKADLTEAMADANRQESLYETSDASLASLEAAQARVLRAESQVAQIEHGIAISKARIRQAERDLDNTIIRSPIDGVMTQRQADVGELVVVGTLNSPGSVILEIADLSRMLVQTRIDESNIALVKAGQPATVYLNAFPDQEFVGEVTFVGLARLLWRDGSGYVEAEVLVEPEDELRLQTGLTANVDIEIATLTDVVKVPSQAVLDRRVEDLPDDVVQSSDLVDRTRTFTRVVYVMTEDGTCEVRPVQIGASDLTDTVILAGVDAGDRVIIGPFRSLGALKDGEAVKLEEDENDENTNEDAEDEDTKSETASGAETVGRG